MHKVNIKPLSVNAAWQGKRFKSPAYKQYERELGMILPRLTVPEGPLLIVLEFGVSNLASDFDNPVKPFVDVLQKRYGFNDSRITGAVIRKVKTDKGGEFVRFDLQAMPSNF